MKKLTFVVYFFSIHLAVGWVKPSSATMESDVIVNNRVQKLVDQRRRLVRDLNLISDGLARSRIAKNQMDTDLFLDQLDRIIWPKMIDLSTTIFDNLVADDELNREFNYQEELRKEVASIRFKAKARRCKSPDETFYPPLKRCVPYQGRRLANPCPSHQQLYDGPDNIGICDCQNLRNANGSRAFLLYSDRTKQCHQLYTQGPCRRGHWWIIKNRVPQCQIVPKDCPADGQHVFWTTPGKKSNSKSSPTSSKCWKLQSRGPCPEDQFLELDDNSIIHCRPASLLLTLPSIAVAPRRVRPSSPLGRPVTWCPRGSYRDRTLKCHASF